MDCKTALRVVLDQVDYTAGACAVNEMVGAVLSREVINLAREAIAEEEKKYPPYEWIKSHGLAASSIEYVLAAWEVAGRDVNGSWDHGRVQAYFKQKRG